jgi:predicted  nucleic acid-binding Zn-ribbon protein
VYDERTENVRNVQIGTGIGNMRNGTYFTIGQASTETGRAKSTIKKAIDTGEMSVSEKTARGFKIEASELFRVFPKRSENTDREQIETTSKTIENSTLQAKLDAAQQRYGDAEKTIEDLRERLSKSDDERTRLTTLLTDQRGKPSEPRKWFWQR